MEKRDIYSLSLLLIFLIFNLCVTYSWTQGRVSINLYEEIKESENHNESEQIDVIQFPYDIELHHHLTYNATPTDLICIYYDSSIQLCSGHNKSIFSPPESV